MPYLHSLGGNQLKDEGVTMVCDALRDSKVSKLNDLELWSNGITVTGAKSVAAYLAVTGHLTKCKLRKNKLGVEGWTSIFNALRDSPSSKITEWDLSGEQLGPKIAKPLAEYISVTGQLTSVWTPGH